MAPLVNPPPPKLLKVAALARKLEVSQKTLKRWARDGLIPCHRMGRQWLRFEEEAVRGAMKKFKP